MEYVVGIVLAVAVSCFALWTGLDRDRGFYPTVVIVIASYYVLFAVMGGSGYVLVIELIPMAAFVLVAVIGFKFNRWLVVFCLGAHGVFDVLHDLVVANPGVPEWWPGFCLTFDIGAAVFLACRVRARPDLLARAAASAEASGVAVGVTERSPEQKRCTGAPQSVSFEVAPSLQSRIRRGPQQSRHTAQSRVWA